MPVKKRIPPSPPQYPDPLVDGLLIAGFAIAVTIGIYGLVRLFKR